MYIHIKRVGSVQKNHNRGTKKTIENTFYRENTFYKQKKTHHNCGRI